MACSDRVGALRDALFHAGQSLKLLMHHAEDELSPRLNVTRAYWPRLNVRGSGEATCIVRQLIQLRNQLAGADKRVSPAMHIVSVCMSIFAMQCHFKDINTLPPLNPAYWLTSLLQRGLLLDVNLKMRRKWEISKCVGAIPNISDGFQGLAQRFSASIVGLALVRRRYRTLARKDA